MKLLDPFAGYRLASGHSLFHISLFIGSYLVPLFGEEGFDSDGQISEAFSLLRWVHLAVFLIGILNEYLKMASPIKEEAEDADGEEQDTKLKNMKVVHRDGGKRLISRVLATIEVFAYQGTVFYI